MRIVQVLRNRLMCGPGAALTVRKLPGSAWIDLTARGSSQTGVKNAQNEANGNRRLTLWLQRSSVRWLRPFPRRTDPIPGRRGRDIDGLAMPEAVTKTSSAHLGSGGSKCLQRDGTARKLGADEPKMRLHLVDCDCITSDGFDRPPAIEPNPGTRPRSQHLE